MSTINQSKYFSIPGVGQSEYAVADMVDMFVVLIPPAGGDELQVHNSNVNILKIILTIVCIFLGEGFEARYNGAQPFSSCEQS